MSRLLTLHDPAVARAYYQAGLWRDDTLYGLAAGHARDRGGARALRDPYRTLTWSELVAGVDRVAADLHGRGLKAGDRVSVWMSNRIEAIVVFLACSRNGYVFNTSLHQTYRVDEVIALLEQVQCRAFFGQVGYGADGREADVFSRAAGLPSMRCVYALPSRAGEGDMPAGARAFPSGGVDALPPRADDPDQIVYLAFTSGTTGAPKGVMHSANTLLANARAMVDDWGHDSETVLLTLSQLSHHIGIVALNQALVGGFELVLNDPGAGLDPIAWIEQTGATYVMGVPTHAIDILSALNRRGLARLGRVGIFYMAGAPIPTETATQLLGLGIKPQNVYGMTENGSHQYTMPDDDTPTITGTCGKSCAVYEIRLFGTDDPDREAEPGAVGEIGGRGAMRMLGYFADQDATERSFNAGGWFMSGDLGQFDANGNLRIVGRQKDMIIRGGHNIHPARIENLAMSHPSILKAAAVAVPDERLGERVCLAIIPKEDVAPSAEELLGHLHDAGLSKFDMPEFLAVLETLPMGPTGKILKRELAGWIRSGRVSPEPVRWRATAAEMAQ